MEIWEDQFVTFVVGDVHSNNVNQYCNIFPIHLMSISSCENFHGKTYDDTFSLMNNRYCMPFLFASLIYFESTAFEAFLA